MTQQGTDAGSASVLEQQQKDWPRRVALGRDGNPFATLCRRCYGRHAPPHDDLCQRDPPPGSAA